jgi:hypothetical protein
MESVKHINFLFNGVEYSAHFDAEDTITHIYDFRQGRCLREDTDNGTRENPGVWVVAYSMLDD